ncbi:sensor histidine kinase [Kitasatospora viridis]|uniref:histidine kinase n=1 Tax=Kitasatospora viridis TaxID=281105 RepID=A0A561S9F9_9ACTN|nr:histidine kinase [Kitasatospora viridis]TWF71500.1 signal transduction histidine kinase [Kitasatospora viridis]
MAESLLPVGVRRWRPGTAPVIRAGRRCCAESLYLLTAPVTAVAGLALAAAGLVLAAPGVPSSARARGPARWAGDLEWWRIGAVGARSGAWRRVGPASWREPLHALALLPLTLATWAVTAMWWFVGLATVSFPLRVEVRPGTLRPMTLYAGGEQSHVALSLGLTSPGERTAFAVTLGLSLLLTLPLATRACVAVQAGLGRALLADRTARARAAAEAGAEGAALRRLERDIHDGPQQRLVRLALELGRARRHLDSRPEAVREALTDALAQTREALDELRALSRGIAPPILADRGLRAALAVLAASSPVPAELDDENADLTDSQLTAAVESAAYFVVAEALANAAKHSRAERCTVGLRHAPGTLRVWVSDDGVGGAAPGKGHGLRGLEERVGAVGGRLRVASPAGGPTTVTAELPCR